MESVLWAFKNMYDQNLVYKGFKVQRYCPSCATSLSNAEVNEGYQERQDPAITIKFKINGTPLWKDKHHEITDDGFVDVVAGIIKKDNQFFVIHHQKENLWFFPGGKVDTGETLDQALARELKEELNIQFSSAKKIGAVKIIHQNKPRRVHYFMIETTDTPVIQENEKHTTARWLSKVEFDNNLGYALKIDDILIETESELQREFIDFYLLEKNILTKEGIEDAPMYFLAWTTTPWTLPGNSFLAVGNHITYVIVYDL